MLTTVVDVAATASRISKTRMEVVSAPDELAVAFALPPPVTMSELASTSIAQVADRSVVPAAAVAFTWNQDAELPAGRSPAVPAAPKRKAHSDADKRVAVDEVGAPAPATQPELALTVYPVGAVISKELIASLALLVFSTVNVKAVDCPR